MQPAYAIQGKGIDLATARRGGLDRLISAVYFIPVFCWTVIWNIWLGQKIIFTGDSVTTPDQAFWESGAFWAT